MDATDVPKTPQVTDQRQQQNRFMPPSVDTSTQNLSSCEQQKAAYKKSVECYSRCQMNNRTSNFVNNVAACSNCVDVKKPNCN